MKKYYPTLRNKSRKLYKEYVESKLMDQQINREIEERMGV